MRCLTLADELARRGNEIYFLCRELPGNVSFLVTEKGHPLELLPPPEPNHTQNAWAGKPDYTSWLGIDPNSDARQTLEAMERIGSPIDWVIVDHYAIDAVWERQIRASCKKIFVIDDLANRRHDCDLLLDQNLYSNPEQRYQQLIPTHSRALIGPDYALLRPEFATINRSTPVRNGNVKKVLVFFGGGDPSNETLKALMALEHPKRLDLTIDAVIGANNPHKEQIASFCDSRPEFNLHVQTPRMAELMASADLSIGAAGVASWERCAAGLPCMVSILAENQENNARELEKFGACCNLGNAHQITGETLAQQLEELMHDPSKVAAMSRAAATLVDGKGTSRIASALFEMQDSISLRPATQDDADAIFIWRNDERTLRYIFNKQPVERVEHDQWMANVLRDPKRHLLIGEHQGKPIGVIRFDVSGESAEISIYLVPGLSGRGFGSALIKASTPWAISNLPGVVKIQARILPENVASLKVFEKAGYREAYRMLEVDIPHQ